MTIAGRVRRVRSACQLGVMRCGSRLAMSSSSFLQAPRSIISRTQARALRHQGGSGSARGRTDEDLLRLVHRRHLGGDPHSAARLDVSRLRRVRAPGLRGLRADPGADQHRVDPVQPRQCDLGTDRRTDARPATDSSHHARVRAALGGELRRAESSAHRVALRDRARRAARLRHARRRRADRDDARGALVLRSSRARDGDCAHGHVARRHPAHAADRRARRAPRMASGAPGRRMRRGTRAGRAGPDRAREARPR